MNFGPTRTSLAEVVAADIGHMRTTKTKRGVASDLCYLRKAFGPLCPELENTNARKPQAKGQIDRRTREPRIEAAYFEQITTELSAAV